MKCIRKRNLLKKNKKPRHYAGLFVADGSLQNKTECTLADALFEYRQKGILTPEYIEPVGNSRN
jgi:hypothetical protein